MFHCKRCGIRFSTGALAGRKDCPRCRVRDGVSVELLWEPTPLRPPRPPARGSGVPAGR